MSLPVFHRSTAAVIAGFALVHLIARLNRYCQGRWFESHSGRMIYTASARFGDSPLRAVANADFVAQLNERALDIRAGRRGKLPGRHPLPTEWTPGARWRGSRARARLAPSRHHAPLNFRLTVPCPTSQRVSTAKTGVYGTRDSTRSQPAGAQPLRLASHPPVKLRSSPFSGNSTC